MGHVYYLLVLQTHAIHRRLFSFTPLLPPLFRMLPLVAFRGWVFVCLRTVQFIEHKWITSQIQQVNLEWLVTASHHPKHHFNRIFLRIIPCLVPSICYYLFLYIIYFFCLDLSVSYFSAISRTHSSPGLMNFVSVRT